MEKVGPLHGMDLPEWLEKQRSLEGEVRWFKKLLRDALKGGLSEERREALEEVAKDEEGDES